MKRALLLGIACMAFSGCLSVEQPKTISIDALFPADSSQMAGNTQFFVSIERFIDVRSNPGILGYAQLGLSGSVPISADGDLSEAVEHTVTAVLEKKGVIRGRSPLALRGTIERLSVNSLPLSSMYTSAVEIQLSLVDTRTTALLWEREYGGNGTAGDPQSALATAFRVVREAISADNSILKSRKDYLIAGGTPPVLGAVQPVFAHTPTPTFHSDVDNPDYHSAPKPDDFAVVIGVEKYAQNLPDAQFADRDAKVFRRHLIAMGIPLRHILYLDGERASKSAFIMSINRWLPKNVKSDSTVFFYFSGHGAPNPITEDAYLLPFDGNPEDLEDTAYSMRQLYASLSRLKAHRVIIALDSCFSGAGGRSVIARGTRPLVTHVKEGTIPEKGKLVVFTASKSNQISGVIEEQGHGAFTYYLLKGLNGKALDSRKHVTVQSLYRYLAPKVSDVANLDNRDQTPQLFPRSARNPDSQIMLR